MSAALRLSRLIDAFSQRVGVVGYWLVPLMVLVGVWNVFGRFLPQILSRFFGIDLDFNLTSNVLIELQWYIFSLVIFLGAPYALLHDEHVRVDVLFGRFNERRQAWINLFGTLLFLIPFCSLLIYFSWNFVAASWRILEDSPDPSGLPRYPIKTLIPVGAGLLILQGVSEIIKNAARLRGALPRESETTAAKDEEDEGKTEESVEEQLTYGSAQHESHTAEDDEQSDSTSMAQEPHEQKNQPRE